MQYVERYLAQTKEVIDKIDSADIYKMVSVLKQVRDQQGRVFVIGSGGGAGHASHAVCDFRKLCGLEAYSPLDNVSELTARINDEGWETSLSQYLLGCHMNPKDCLFVFSVGGGDEEQKISVNLTHAIKVAKKAGAKVLGIVGRDGGFTAKNADACVIVPTVDSKWITPHTEGMQAVIWHLLVSSPDLQMHTTKWESLQSEEINVR